MIGAYVAVRAWSAHAAEQDIARWHRMHAPLASQIEGTDPVGVKLALSTLQIERLNTAGWSEKRLAEYRESLRDRTPVEAVLRVPRLELQVPIYEGTSESALSRGAGRIAGTAKLDSSAGNVGIAAHRDGFFRALKDIVVGDEIQLDTRVESRRYRVSRIQIVEPSDVGVLDPTPFGSITLVTCYPFYFVGSAPKRFIVQASLVPRNPPRTAADALAAD